MVLVTLIERSSVNEKFELNQLFRRLRRQLER